MPHFDPLTPQDVSLVSRDGQPVACVSYGRHELLIGEASLRFGSLGNLATELAHQHQGLGTCLMIEALRQMRARGDHVTCLLPYSFAFYRRFGYEVGGEHWGLLVRPAQFGQEEFALPACASGQGVRPFRREDLQAMAALYQDWLRQRGWGLVRPPAYWAWAGTWLTEHNCFVCAGGGDAEGYLVAEVTPRLQLPDEYTFRRADDPLWPGELGPVLHIVEMVAATPAARRALVGFLAARARGVAAVVWPLACRSDLEACGLLAPPARVRLMPGFMARVIDAAEAIRARADLPAPEEAFSIMVDDPVAPDMGINAETLALQPAARGLEVVVGRRERHHLRLDVRAFSQMYVGYRSAGDLWALGRLEASSGRAVALAEQVFPRYDACLGEMDLF